jgi:hypothetical protein
MRQVVESDPVAGHPVVELPLGNRIKHIIAAGFSCDKQEVEEKIPIAVLNVFVSGTRVTFGQKVTPL